MDWQILINIGGGLVIGMMGWFARELWDMVQKLKDDVQKLEVKMSEEYLKKVDVNNRFDKIDAILSKIFDKLDEKVDK